jgi:hypothetical protein
VQERDGGHVVVAVDGGRVLAGPFATQARALSLVGSLVGYHPPNATSRVLHIAATTWNQVDVGVANGLASRFAIVHANIETAHHSVLLHDFDLQPIKQLIYRASLGLEQVEECCGMPLRDHERVQRCDRMQIADRNSEDIRSDDAVGWKFAEDAAWLTCVDTLAYQAKIMVIPRALVSVAFET